MTLNAFMRLTPYGQTSPLTSSENTADGHLWTYNGQPFTVPTPALFSLLDWSVDVEQTLNIGSQSSGSGAGKVTFNPLSITRHADLLSPTFFTQLCSGTAFQFLNLYLVNVKANQVIQSFTFKLVAFKTISYTYDDAYPVENITFEYGGMQVDYAITGKSSLKGWNRVKNVMDNTGDPIS